jgi:hypothetical protein
MQIEDLKKTVRKAEDKNNSVKNVVKNKFLDDIQSLNDINNIFDSCVIKTNSWYMYGSGKQGQCYELSHIINSINLHIYLNIFIILFLKLN